MFFSNKEEKKKKIHSLTQEYTENWSPLGFRS